MKTKEQTKWTAGPWQVVWPLGNLEVTEVRTVEDEQTGHVATLGVSFDKGTTQANARLLAAGPCLLAACEIALAYMEENADDDQEREDYTTIKAAIAKARGAE
jgi:hypothetical protein